MAGLLYLCKGIMCMFVCVIWIQQIPIFDEQFWYWYKVTTSCKLISHFWTALKQTYFFFLRGESDYLWIVDYMFTISRRLFPRVALILKIESTFSKIERKQNYIDQNIDSMDLVTIKKSLLLKKYSIYQISTPISISLSK